MNDSLSVTSPPPTVERQEVLSSELSEVGIDPARDFPGSTAADFKRYPVLSEGGWFMVVKHQPTLTTVSRTPWERLGPIELTSKGLRID